MFRSPSFSSDSNSIGLAIIPYQSAIADTQPPTKMCNQPSPMIANEATVKLLNKRIAPVNCTSLLAVAYGRMLIGDVLLNFCAKPRLGEGRAKRRVRAANAAPNFHSHRWR